jgi:DNA polymerase-3 subunit epsilon
MDYHCTYRLAQELLPLNSFRLSDVSEHYKIKLKHHNAESDAKAAALIALKLCEQQKVNSLEQLSIRSGFKVGKIISQTNSYRPFSKH